jgi:uncharacterized membrane protein YiaA
MSFALYVIGFAVMILGLALAAHLLGVSGKWIGVFVIFMAGIGILKAASRTRHRDPSR